VNELRNLLDEKEDQERCKHRLKEQCKVFGGIIRLNDLIGKTFDERL